VTEDELKLPGYNPTWYDDAQEMIAGSRLMALRGSEIHEAWTLWGSSGWVDRAPVILVMGDTRLEVCARGVTQFSVTRDTLVMDSPVQASGPGGESGEPVWKKNENHELAAIVNKPITEVGAVEYQLDPMARRRFKKEWVLSGIYLRFDKAHLEIFNGLDCNRMSNMPDRDHPVRYVSCAQWPTLVSGGSTR